MKIGDIVVFIQKSVEDEHFKHFIYGNQYKIKSFHSLPDGDIYGIYTAVTFENCEYGCLSIYLDKYFVNLEEFRNKKINNIIK